MAPSRIAAKYVGMRFVVIGGGPAGLRAASSAARLGAEVVVVERDVVGGAANLWDCVPSKAMISTGGLVSRARRAEILGLEPLTPKVDLTALAVRVRDVEDRLASSGTRQLESQGVRIIRGSARMTGPHRVEVDMAGEQPEVLDADAVLVATGSSPRIPDWADVDGERVLSTRQAYPPPVIPEHLVVIGSGVTGVEFVHMFLSLGSNVTLIVSRQQVLPNEGSGGGGRSRGRLSRPGRQALHRCSRRRHRSRRRRGRRALRRRPFGAGQPRPHLHRLRPFAAPGSGWNLPE